MSREACPGTCVFRSKFGRHSLEIERLQRPASDLLMHAGANFKRIREADAGYFQIVQPLLGQVREYGKTNLLGCGRPQTTLTQFARVDGLSGLRTDDMERALGCLHDGGNLRTIG